MDVFGQVYKGGLCPPNPPPPRLAAGYWPQCSLRSQTYGSAGGTPCTPQFYCEDTWEQFLTNVLQLLHIGRNTFIEIISPKYKLGCFQLTASYFGGVRSFCSITLHNRNGGCWGLPLLSRRCATEGSTEVSSPLLSVGFRGAKPPFILFGGVARCFKKISMNV